MRSECLPGCGLCCSYKVALLPGDAERIERLGYQQGRFACDGALQKDDGFCVFLEEDRRCSIYDERPGLCRSFPFFLEDDGSIDIDLSCPGVDRGPEIEPVFGYEAGGAIDKKTAGRLPNYLPFEKFREIGLDWCRANARPDSLGELLLSAQDQIRRANRMPIRGFAGLLEITDCMNTHITADGITTYPFFLRDESVIIVDRTYPMTIQEMPAECVEAFVDYLRTWFGRYVFYRFCLACSAGMPTTLRPMGMAFYFAGQLVERISGLTAVLIQRWDQDDMESMKEAIRAIDGRLRTKCRSAQIQIVTH
ncbi:MAG TPA: YkgJ family cysteine cluster protein [Armatimonadota bacterium]|nr:YkgJ family cysteine cluster protein [Armatimonadota bacterium]